MSELMKNVYYTPANPGSLGGKKRLKDAVLKDTGVRLTDKQVTDWLAGEDANTLHRTAPINYKRNRVVVYGIDTQFQADLVDMTAYSKENANNNYLLTCIDVFSKYAWARALKNKSGLEVTKVKSSQVKSSHLYLYSAFNNTDCVKALNSIKLEDRVSVMYNNKIKHSISVKGISLLNSEMSLSS